jgi:hypothetical protein
MGAVLLFQTQIIIKSIQVIVTELRTLQQLRYAPGVNWLHMKNQTFDTKSKFREKKTRTVRGSNIFHLKILDLAGFRSYIWIPTSKSRETITFILKVRLFHLFEQQAKLIITFLTSLYYLTIWKTSCFLKIISKCFRMASGA